MRWFFTRDAALSEAVSNEDGDVLVSGPDVWQDAFLDDQDPESDDYPIKHLTTSLKVDALVVVDFLRFVDENKIGYHKGRVLRWSGLVKGRMLVSYDESGESYRTLKRHGAAGCMIRPANFHVYVTRNEEVARATAQSIRTVLWSEGGDISSVIPTIKQAFSTRYPGPLGQSPYLA